MLFIIEGNNNVLDNMDFLQLGRLVALTIMQCDPGLPVFDSPVAECILSESINHLECILSESINHLDHTDFPTKYRSLVELVTFIYTQLIR